MWRNAATGFQASIQHEQGFSVCLTVRRLKEWLYTALFQEEWNSFLSFVKWWGLWFVVPAMITVFKCYLHLDMCTRLRSQDRKWKCQVPRILKYFICIFLDCKIIYHAFKNPESESEPTKAFSCGDKVSLIPVSWSIAGVGARTWVMLGTCSTTVPHSRPHEDFTSWIQDFKSECRR